VQYLELSQIVELGSTRSPVNASSVFFLSHLCTPAAAHEQASSNTAGFPCSREKSQPLLQALVGLVSQSSEMRHGGKGLRNSKLQQFCPAKYASLVLC